MLKNTIFLSKRIHLEKILPITSLEGIMNGTFMVRNLMYKNIFLLTDTRIRIFIEKMFEPKIGEMIMKYNMQKEIYEQPEVLKEVVAKYISKDKINIKIPKKIHSIKIVASGSSYNCAGIASSLFNKHTNINTASFYSGEFIAQKNIHVNKNDLFIFISQSGETSDTLEALKMVKKAGVNTFCITNNENSSIYNLCDYKVLSLAGKEYSIASTKAVSGQLLCLWLLVLKTMQSNKVEIDQELKSLKWLPLLIKEQLNDIIQIKTASKILAKHNNIVVLGAGSNYALAKEAALKIKETSYINANAYPIGEFMHGHVAVLNEKSAVIAIIDKENQRQHKRHLKQIKEDYNPTIITVSFGKTPKTIGNINFNLSEKTETEQMFLALTILQLIAFEVAKILKRDIDRPKGLKKVVKN